MKKIFLILCLIVFAANTNFDTLASANTINIRDNIYIEDELMNTLQQYFDERSLNFFGIVESNDNKIAEEQMKRTEALSRWENDCEFQIANVNLTGNIIGRNDDSYNEIILYVSEFNEITYQFNNENAQRVMEYEILHVMHFDRYSYDIIMDSYNEFSTYYETGSEEDLFKVRGGDIDTGDLSLQKSILLNTISGDSSEYNHLRTYSYTNAVSYSETWWNQFNPSYYCYYYADINGNVLVNTDCCNFVSQCILYGGMPLSTLWKTMLRPSTNPQFDSAYQYSTLPWMCTSDFMIYWYNQGIFLKEVTSLSDIGQGNPIFWLQGESNRTYTQIYPNNHNMMIVGVNSTGNVLVNAYNNFAHQVPKNKYVDRLYTLWF